MSAIHHAHRQRGETEARNGYGHGMLPGYGPRDRHLSSLAPSGSPACKLSAAPELERCPSRGPCVIGRGASPIFHSQMSASDHQLHQIT